MEGDLLYLDINVNESNRIKIKCHMKKVVQGTVHCVLNSTSNRLAFDQALGQKKCAGPKFSTQKIGLQNNQPVRKKKKIGNKDHLKTIIKEHQKNPDRISS